MSSRTGCLICGAPLHYFQQERELECALCHRKFPANASCEAGHFVCDECHARRGLEVIREACGKSASRDPITLMQEIMENHCRLAQEAFVSPSYRISDLCKQYP